MFAGGCPHVLCQAGDGVRFLTAIHMIELAGTILSQYD